MKKIDENRLTMWRTTEHHLVANTSIWDKFEPFAEAVKELRMAINECWTTAETQAMGSGAISRTRDLTKKEVITLVYGIARFAKAFALSTNNEALYYVCNHGKATLALLSQTDLIATLRNIINAAKPYAEALVRYNLPPETYDDALEAIETLAKKQNDVRHTISERKALTGNVSSVMKRGAKALKKLDNMIHFFEAEYPDFVAGYKTARTVIHTGIRHNKDEGPTGNEPQANASMEDSSENG